MIVIIDSAGYARHTATCVSRAASAWPEGTVETRTYSNDGMVPALIGKARSDGALFVVVPREYPAGHPMFQSACRNLWLSDTLVFSASTYEGKNRDALRTLHYGVFIDRHPRKGRIVTVSGQEPSYGMCHLAGLAAKVRATDPEWWTARRLQSSIYARHREHVASGREDWWGWPDGLVEKEARDGA